VKLTVRDDGFGYDTAGRRYWRSSGGRWVRAHLCTTKVAVAPLLGFFGPPRPVKQVVYQYGGEDRVYVMETM
jgi:hypothetical protein